MGVKTLYYANTYDGKTDIDDRPDVLEDTTKIEEEKTEEEDCDSCTI